jgi:hypothetical protein
MTIDPHPYNVSVSRGMFDGEEPFEARFKEPPDVVEYGGELPRCLRSGRRYHRNGCGSLCGAGAVLSAGLAARRRLQRPSNAAHPTQFAPGACCRGRRLGCQPERAPGRSAAILLRVYRLPRRPDDDADKLDDSPEAGRDAKVTAASAGFDDDHARCAWLSRDHVLNRSAL